MTGDAMEQAVEAAAVAMWKRDYAPMGTQWFEGKEPEGWHWSLARRAAEAAAPILQADERERVLAPIRALLDACSTNAHVRLAKTESGPDGLAVLASTYSKTLDDIEAAIEEASHA